METVEKGLQVVIRERPLPRPPKVEKVSLRRVLVVFGSDQGLCGRFNEKLAEFIHTKTGEWQDASTISHMLVIGARIGARLEAEGRMVSEQFWVPGSVNGITAGVYQILLSLEAVQNQGLVTHIDLFYNRHKLGLGGIPTHQQLLPLDQDHLLELRGRKWPGRSVPQIGAEAGRLFSSLIRQYFFVSLFRAQAQSLAGEQASRLSSLQNAEKNIEEHVGELLAEYRVRRQASITSELLDLVAGFKTSSRRNKGEPEDEPADDPEDSAGEVA